MLNRVAAPPAKPSRPRHIASDAARPKRRARPPVGRNPVLIAAVAAVVVAVGVIVAISLRDGGSSASGTAAKAEPPRLASAAVVRALTQPDPAMLAAVGSAGLPSTFVPLTAATPLRGADGKPQLLYVGAEYCPFCAAQRWSLVMALSRFGSFDHLALTTSSSSDSFPDTATFTFYDVTYTSAYLDLAAVELSDRNGQPMEALSDAQKALLSTYDAPPYVTAAAAGGIPWIDLGGRYAMVSSGFTPQLLAGLDWDQIAARLSDTNQLVTKGIAGNANNITAAICKVTGMQPASVCGTAPVAQIAAQMP